MAAKTVARRHKPHCFAGATQAAPLEEERSLQMDSHHDGDETEGSPGDFTLTCKGCLGYHELRLLEPSARLGGPKAQPLRFEAERAPEIMHQFGCFRRT